MRWCSTGILLLLCSSGCSSPASIEIEPANPLITGKGESVTLEATVKDRSGKTLSGVPVTFSSMTPTMASVDSSGRVQPITSGMATILVSAGKATREVEVIIQIPKKILIDPDSPMMMLGVTKGFKATVVNDRDQPLIAGGVKWATSDPSIFTVDKYGNVKTLKEGEAKLTAFSAGISGSTPIVVKHEELREDGSLSQ